MEKIGRSIPVTRPYKLPFESNKWGGAYTNRDILSYVSVANDASLNTNSLTIMIMVKNPPNSFAEQNVIDKRSATGGFNFRLSTSSVSIVLVNSAGAEFHNPIPNVDDFGLKHFAGTWDGTTRKTYVNGILGETDMPIIDTIANGNAGLKICAGPATIFSFLGITYDYIQIAQSLTQPQIQDLMYGRILPTQFDCRLWHDYRLGHARDLSGNGNHGTITGNVRFV